MSHISYIQYKTIKEMEDYKQTLYNDELLNILPDGVIIFDTNGEVIQLNQQAFVELHVHPSVNDMLPFPTNRLFKLLNKKEDILSTILEKIRQGENTYSLPEHTFMQEQVDYTQFPIRGEFATIRDRTNLNKILFFFRNITVELTQEYILNTALQRTRIYPWYYDISRSEFTLDDRYFEHLGIPAGENNTLTMEEYVNMIHPDDRQPMADAFVVQLSGNTTFDKTVPFRLRRGDGTWEWFEGQSTYIANISGHPYRLVGICLSIQEYKDIENTLIEARKKAEESDRLKMAFLANMSHEIRTPLNAIVGFSDVIGSTYDELSEEERADFVRLISINSEHLVRLIDDILDLSKIESNTIKFTFSNCSLNSLMMDIEKEQAMKPISEIEIKSLLPDEDVYINTDITRLKQVICNFINNARKFTQKGYIHFGYTLDNRNADSVQIFVEDTGSGIPQECLNEIFDRFYKVDTFKQGTGLGLSICKAIADATGGEVGFKSKANIGSEFWYIGYTDVEYVEKSEVADEDLNNKSTEHLSANSSVKIKDLNILIAEDNDSNYLLIKKLLKDNQLTRTITGVEAIEKIKAQTFDIVFMDMRMPVMNGLEATSLIREFNQTTPIIALTANAFDSDRENALAAGCNHFMTKPVKKRELMDLLFRYFKQQPQ